MSRHSAIHPASGAVAAPADAPRILLVIPCYNEDASIGDLLGEIAQTGCGYHTLVVDDGSMDAPAAVACARSPVARLTQNLGIGGAVQTGFKNAARRGCATAAPSRFSRSAIRWTFRSRSRWPGRGAPASPPARRRSGCARARPA